MGISRRKFLQWIGLGAAGIVVPQLPVQNNAVVSSHQSELVLPAIPNLRPSVKHVATIHQDFIAVTHNFGTGAAEAWTFYGLQRLGIQGEGIAYDWREGLTTRLDDGTEARWFVDWSVEPPLAARLS